MEFQRAYNAYFFERTLNAIFGSQLRLLKHLLVKGDEGDSYVALHSCRTPQLSHSTASMQILGFDEPRIRALSRVSEAVQLYQVRRGSDAGVHHSLWN